jgi:hypothetical protein
MKRGGVDKEGRETSLFGLEISHHLRGHLPHVDELLILHVGLSDENIDSLDVFDVRVAVEDLSDLSPQGRVGYVECIELHTYD